MYGLLYLFLTFYPIVFQQIHGFNEGVGGLPFFGMITGEMLAGLYMILQQPSYNKKLAVSLRNEPPASEILLTLLGRPTTISRSQSGVCRLSSLAARCLLSAYSGLAGVAIERTSTGLLQRSPGCSLVSVS